MIVFPRRIVDQLDAAVEKEKPLSTEKIYTECLQQAHSVVKSVTLFQVTTKATTTETTATTILE